MKNLLKLISFFVLAMSVKAILAQKAIPASGGIASGSRGTESDSAGQVVYVDNTGTKGSLAQVCNNPVIFQLSPA
jgi:hypothetical protein